MFHRVAGVGGSIAGRDVREGIGGSTGWGVRNARAIAYLLVERAVPPSDLQSVGFATQLCVRVPAGLR